MKPPVGEQFAQAPISKLLLHHIGRQEGKTDSLNGRLPYYVELGHLQCGRDVDIDGLF